MCMMNASILFHSVEIIMISEYEREVVQVITELLTKQSTTKMLL